MGDLRRPGVAAAALLLSLLAAEGAVRLARPARGLPPPPPPRTIDPYAANPYVASLRPYLMTFLPGARYRAQRSSYTVEYAINERGFRGPEIHDRGGRRLLLVGDSIPEGHGVEFAESLAPLLSTRRGGGGPSGDDDWTVVNAAMQGGSPLLYAANLPRYLALEPDAVLLLLYENDLRDDRIGEERYFDLPRLETSSGSRLMTLARAVLAGEPETPLEADIRRNRDAPWPDVEPDPITPIIVPPEAFGPQWRASAVYLDRFADGLEARDIPLLVGVFALGPLVPRVPAAHHAHARNLEKHARAWAASRDLPFLSLYPVAENAFATLPWEEVMLPDDGHPTPRLQRRLADSLAPFVRRHLACASADEREGAPGPGQDPVGRACAAR